MTIDELALTVTPSNCTIPFTSADGVFVGNGKLGVITSLGDEIDVTRVVITRDVKYQNGLYQPNVIDIFSPCRWSFFQMNYTMVDCENMSNTLVFDNGMHQTLYRITNLTNSAEVHCLVKLYALRHAPYTFLQTLEITPQYLNGACNMDLFHEVYTQTIATSVNYNHTFISSQDKRYYQLYGNCMIDGLEVAFTSTYLPESSNAILHGAIRNDASLLPNTIAYRIQLQNIVENQPVRIHVFTTIMSSDDFSNPCTETRVACSAIATARSSITDTISYHINKHVTAWSMLWNSKVRITPIPNALQLELDEVTLLNKLLNTALYNIYSSIRENFISDLGNGLPIIDMQGTFLYDSDVWLIPLLLIIKPSLAKAVIEFRYTMLGVAQRLAASYSFEGAKYPFINDIIGYKNNLYYTSTTFTYIYNTALVSINTWNYYRVSQDINWLREKGYKILTNIANYLCDVAVYNENSNTYTFTDTVSINGTISVQNNALTNNLSRLAIRYALEASYALKTDRIPKWNDVYDGIDVLKWPLTYEMFHVTRFDTSAHDTDKFNIIEVLMLFLPSLWEEELGMVSENIFNRVIKANMDFYIGALDSQYVTLPTNLSLISILAAVSANTFTSQLDLFKSSLQSFITNNIYGPWYYMRSEARLMPSYGDAFIRSLSTMYTPKNSIYTNAMFLSIFTQGIAQARLVGGIGENLFPYTDFKITTSGTSVIPANWNMITLYNIGINTTLRTHDIRPSDLQYTGSNNSNVDFPIFGGSSGIYLFDIYTP
jgi:hypothetical protein